MINKLKDKQRKAQESLANIPENLPIVTYHVKNRRELKIHGKRIAEIIKSIEKIEVDFLNEIFNAEHDGVNTPYEEIYLKYEGKFNRFMKSKHNQGYFDPGSGMTANMNFFVWEYGPTEKEDDLNIIEKAAKFFRKLSNSTTNIYDCKKLFKDVTPPED